MKLPALLTSIIFSMLYMTLASAQTSVGYQGISIPIVKPKSYLNATPNCSDLSTTRKNIIYIDDLGPYPSRTSGRPVFLGGGDPNGFQDMVIVLGFGKKYNNKINLLGVGTTNKGAEDYELLKKVVVKSGVKIKAWSEDKIYSRIVFYANCPQTTSANRLAIAMGGEWNKLASALGENSEIRHKIESAGLGSYNIRDCGDPDLVRFARACDYYDGNPLLGYFDVVALLNSGTLYSSSRAYEFADPLFREPYYTNSNFPVSKLNQLYDNYIRKGLIGIKDGKGKLITNSSKNSIYENHIRPQRPNGSRLKIADYLTVAKFIWPNDLDKIHKKEFIHAKIREAVNSIL